MRVCRLAGCVRTAGGRKRAVEGRAGVPAWRPIDDLLEYSWRGNVRELQNCIERAVILTEGDTTHARHLNLSAHADPVVTTSEADDPWSQIDLSGWMAESSRRVLIDVERRKIVRALKDASGNAGIAAELLQVSFKALQAKLKTYQIS